MRAERFAGNQTGGIPEVRKATARDAHDLAAILSDWIDATPWMPRLHTLAQDRAFVASLIESGQVHVVGQNEGFSHVDGDTVTALYVSALSRSRGLGRALLENAKSGRQKLTLMTFAANEPARRFYRREAFVETGGTDGRNDEGLPDIELQWKRT